MFVCLFVFYFSTSVVVDTEFMIDNSSSDFIIESFKRDFKVDLEVGHKDGSCFSFYISPLFGSSSIIIDAEFLTRCSTHLFVVVGKQGKN